MISPWRRARPHRICRARSTRIADAPVAATVMHLSLELALYFLGRAVVAVFLPGFDTEPPARRVWTDSREWSWRGFSRRVGRKRVVTTEASELLGVAVVIGFVALGIAWRS